MEGSTQRGFFLFFTKIFFHFRNLQKYTPAAPLPGGRDLAALQRAAGAFLKKIAEKIAFWSLGAGRPAAGRPALAARLQGDRLSHPYIRVGWSAPPLICITKIPETKKRDGRGEALPDFRAGDCR